MGWLAGYRYRIPFVIVDAEIAANLTDFPVLLKLSTSSGTGAEDISAIFTELGANSRKLAVTNSDGTTENYVEVEQWDNANNIAWLWVALDLTNGQDNTFYFYYDSTVADNANVGTSPNDAASNAVWDANYMMVHHLQGADAASLDDSTSLNHDVSASNGTPDYNYDAKVGHGVYTASASSERISISDDAHLDTYSEATWEYWFYMHTAPAVSGRRCQFNKYLTTGNQRSWLIGLYNDAATLKWKCLLSKLGTAGLENSYTWTPTTDTWYHIGIRWDSVTDTTPVLYINGVATAWTTSAACNASIADSSDVVYLGFYNDGSYHDGAYDEARISNLDRGASYMVANYESQRDHFVDWGTFEIGYSPKTRSSLPGLMTEMLNSKMLFG
jgi:hypothetical protein